MRIYDNRRLLSVLVMMGLSACGGRIAQPVAENRAVDTRLSCEHLGGEYDNLGLRASELVGERSQANLENIYWLTSPLFLDFSGTTGKEMQAIQIRSARLEELMLARGCQDKLDEIEAAKALSVAKDDSLNAR